MYEEILTTYK